MPKLLHHTSYPRPTAVFALVVSFLFLSFASLSAQVPDPEILECSELLSVECELRAGVYLDGSFEGWTPMILALETGSHELEVSSASGVYRRRLSVRSDPRRLSRITAVLQGYAGVLRVDNLSKAACVLIDGEEIPNSGDGVFVLPEGNHGILIAGPGMATFERSIDIRRDSVLVVDALPRPGYPLRFLHQPPEGSRLRIQGPQAGGWKDPGSGLLLPAGRAEFSLRLPSGYELPFAWDPEADPPIALEYLGSLTLEGDFPDSQVFLDGKRVELQGNPPKLALDPGFRRILLRRPGYYDVSFSFEAIPGKAAARTILQFKDRREEEAGLKRIGRPLLAFGGAFALGGAIVNIEGIAVSLAGSYEGYRWIKYLSLGAFGGGLAAFASGITLATIRL